jgi:Phosphotransferase system mannitol/fructose-specific IIA domain (Ntr-type)
MLSQKCAQIISYLCQRANEPGFVSFDELTKKYDVSERTIRYDIDKIDYFLKKNSFNQLLREKGSGIRLDESEENIEKIKEAMRESDMQNYVMSKQERVLFIILMLFEAEDFIKYEEIADKFFVSRKTAIEDVRTIKDEIGENSLKSTKYGIQFNIKEERRRTVLIDYLLDMFSPLELWEISRDIFPNISIAIERQWREIINEEFIEACEKSLYTIENKNRKLLSDDYYYLVIILTALSLTRQSGGFTDGQVMEDNKSDAFFTEFFIEVEKALELKIPAEERRLIQNEVERILHLADNEGLGMKADLIAEQFILRVCEVTEEKYYLDQVLRQSLRQHFERILKPEIRPRAMDKMINKYMYENRVLYDEIFHILEDNFTFIAVEDIKSEAALIELHFLASNERKQTRGNNRYRVLVVCLNGIGTAKMISAVAMKHFPEIEIIDTASLHKVNDLVETIKPDFILTTVPVTSKNVTTIEVHPILEDDDIKKIRSFMQRHPKSDLDHQNVYDELINVINETCDVKDPAALEKKLKNVLNIKTVAKKELNLKDLLTPQTIRTNIAVSNWEEAVRESARPLHHLGFIEERYINAMINNIHKMGPYVVIAPGIAMPHAMPADGVRSSCISMTVLEKEVEFGNAANDPVKLVFCLGSVDNEEHMNVLSELIGLISDKDLIAKIKTATSKEQVLELLKKLW